MASAFQGGAVLLACALGLGVCYANSELEDLLVLEVGGESTPLIKTRRLSTNEPALRPAIELQRPNPAATPLEATPFQSRDRAPTRLQLQSRPLGRRIFGKA